MKLITPNENIKIYSKICDFDGLQFLHPTFHEKHFAMLLALRNRKGIVLKHVMNLWIEHKVYIRRWKFYGSENPELESEDNGEMWII